MVYADVAVPFDHGEATIWLAEATLRVADVRLEGPPASHVGRGDPAAVGEPVLEGPVLGERLDRFTLDLLAEPEIIGTVELWEGRATTASFGLVGASAVHLEGTVVGGFGFEDPFSLDLPMDHRVRALPVGVEIDALDPPTSFRLAVDVEALFRHVAWGSPRLEEGNPWSLETPAHLAELEYGVLAAESYRFEVGW